MMDPLDPMIDAVQDEFDRTRQTLFRLHLQREISEASPLLLDLVAEEGIDLRPWIARLRPPSLWPLFRTEAASQADGWPSVFLLNQLDGRNPHAALDPMFERCHGDGALIRNLSDPRGGLGLRVIGSCLEVVITGPGFMIVSTGELVKLWLDHGLPLSVATAAIGRPVDQLAQHPLMRGRGYEVTAVEPVCSGRCTVVSFRTGLREFRLPLPDGFLPDAQA